MPEKDAAKYRYNVFDITKVWPHKDYPLLPVGRLVLNRNPTNYFAEVEQVLHTKREIPNRGCPMLTPHAVGCLQAAFAPSHLVPGIEASPDRMLQARLFSYADTHRHRLGPNYLQIPINTAFKARVRNQQRDGPMCVDGNQGDAPNYHPNSFGWVYHSCWHKHAVVCPPLALPLPLPLSHTPHLLLTSSASTIADSAVESRLRVHGVAARYDAYKSHPNDDFEQAGTSVPCVCVDGQGLFRHVYSVLLCYTLVVDQATCSAP